MNNKYKKTADQLWQLTYDTFEKQPGNVFRTITGSNGQANEVQFRLMHSVAALKQANTVEQGVLQSVWSDIQLAYSLGFTTEDTHTEMLRLLDSLADQADAA